MPNLDLLFHLQRLHPLFVLFWIIAIINYFEILFHVSIFFKNGSINVGDLLCVGFYSVWTFFGVFFCIVGIEGIREHKRHLLRKYCFRYFICSAILKGIFAILLMVLSADTYFEFFEYASSEPLLYLLVIRFIRSHAPVSLASCHVIAVVFLLFMAYLTHRYGTRMPTPSRPPKTVARDIPEEFAML